MEATGQRRDKDLEARDARLTGSHMNGLHVRRAAALRRSGESRLVEKAESLFEARDQRKRNESQSREKGGHDRDNLEGYCRRCREVHAKHGSAARPGWREDHIIARRFEACSKVVPWREQAQNCRAVVMRPSSGEQMLRTSTDHGAVSGTSLPVQCTPRLLPATSRAIPSAVPRVSTEQPAKRAE